MARPPPTVRERERGAPILALRLDVTAGPDAGASVTSANERLRVGSAEGNDLRLRDETVSRFHLVLVRDGDRAEVIDHGSTNGTGLEDALVEGARIFVRPGSRLGLGRTRLVV